MIEGSTITEKEYVNPMELEFIREHAPRGFYSNVAEALKAEGHEFDRFQVKYELTTLKGEYNLSIINKARHLLKVIKKVEFAAPVQ